MLTALLSILVVYSFTVMLMTLYITSRYLMIVKKPSVRSVVSEIEFRSKEFKQVLDELIAKFPQEASNISHKKPRNPFHRKFNFYWGIFSGTFSICSMEPINTITLLGDSEVREEVFFGSFEKYLLISLKNVVQEITLSTITCKFTISKLEGNSEVNIQDDDYLISPVDDGVIS